MRATGLFFLRAPAFLRVDRTTRAPAAVELPLVEREKNDAGQWVALNMLVAHWHGPEALAFFDANRAELRAGRPLQLDIDRLYGRDGDWHARVVRLELAPLAPSWRRDESQSATPSPPPPPPQAMAQPA